MFKERYIKDNQLIQPDDDFLARMKTAVLQEQQALHIGEYVDYENAEEFSEIENYDFPDSVYSLSAKRMKKWVPFALAACVALVCGVLFGMGNIEFSKQKGLKANVKTMLDKEKTQDDAYAESTFQTFCEMLKTYDAIVYRLDAVADFDDEEILDLKKNANEISDEEKEQLVRDILDNTYQVVSTAEQMQSATYFMVCFDSKQYALLAIDEDELYVIDISEIETLAGK